MLKHRIVTLGAGLGLVFVASTARPAGSSASPAPKSGVQITQLADRLRVEINGQLFTEYYFKDVPRPFCYPIIGPGGVAMTRDWPMKDTPGESHDHPHHRSLWFAHGSVNGKDFWSEQKDFGKQVHQEFLEIKSGSKEGVIRSRNKWVAADGTVACTDERTLRFYNPGRANERVLDFDITLFASNGDVTFGDTKEGTMAIRLAESMRLKGHAGQSHVINSAGDRDEKAWGKRAAWCDYTGLVQDKTVGVAIFDHPKNPHHPTWWHARDYGLFATNPFGQHDFERLPDKKAGNLTVEAGQSITFRFRFYFHEGGAEQAKVAERYKAYAK